MKKGQITIFILLGVLILFGVGIVLFIRSQISETPDKERIERLPLEFQPVQTYIDSCITRILTQGLKEIGESGGYIDLERYGISSNQFDATNENSFRFNPYDPNTAIAYWWYFRSYNKCTKDCYCDSEKPSLDTIEDQLNDYIISEFPKCLNNFESFRKQNYDITSLGDLKAEVTIGDSDVSAYVEYPLKLKKQGSEVKAKKFFVRIPLRFKRIYEFAQEIANTEIKYPYLERWTLEQINGFGLLLDQNYMPPTSGVDFDPSQSPVYWSKQKVKDMFSKMILVAYTPMLQVYGTMNYNDRFNSYYERTTLPVVSPSGEIYYDLLVDFSYLDWWPIYFNIRGRGAEGDLIGPETGSVIDFSFFGIRRYDFYYDVSYPVMVEIKDKNEGLEPYFDKGYVFRFGLETNVRDNKPMNCSGNLLGSVAPPGGTQLCNAGCAGVTIETINAKDNSALEFVNLDYGTTHEMCSIGTTMLDTETGKAQLKAQLPQCVGVGCILKASRYNYFGSSEIYSVRCDTTAPSVCSKEEVICDGETLQLSLDPYRTKNITIKKWRMVKQIGDTWVLRTDAPAPLLKSEMAHISLERIKDVETEQDLLLSAIYYGNETGIELSGLVPGRYTADISLFYELPDDFGRKEIVFKEKKICTPGVLGLGEDCTNIGPYVINETFPVGGSKFNFTLTKQDLDNYNKIIFYVISSPDAGTFDNLNMDDLNKVANIDEYSKQYAGYLEPEFEIK